VENLAVDWGGDTSMKWRSKSQRNIDPIGAVWPRVRLTGFQPVAILRAFVSEG